MSGARLIALAEVARPHGLRGELRLRVYNADSDLLGEQREVILRDPSGGERPMRVESSRPTEGALLMKLEGIDDRDAAAALRGAAVCVPRDRLDAPDEGEFYVCDIAGAKVRGPEGELGVVLDVVSYPTCDVLLVRLAPSGKQTEVPLLDEYVERVSAEEHAVVLRPAALELLS